MTSKSIHFLDAAEQDIDRAEERYFDEGGSVLAARFMDVLEAAFVLIGSHPASGSLRYAGILRVPGLRFRTVRTFPYLVFYAAHEDHIDVVRVLHGARDIPAQFQSE